MKNKILVLVAIAATTLVVSSCLKDNVAVDWTSVSGKMYAQVQFPGLQNQTIVLKAADQFANIIINIATDNPPTSDVTVSCVIDPAVMTAQSAADGVAWGLYPGATLTDPTVTIKAGHKVGYAIVKLPSADTLRISGTYMVPLRITGTSSGVTLAANMDRQALVIGLANQYEGWYHATGFRNHPALGVIPVNKDKYLGTVNINTVKTYPADYTPYEMDIQVNPDNTCTVTSPSTTLHNYTGPGDDPVGRGLAGGANTYDPATKTFVTWVFYNAGAPRICHDVLVRNP